MQILLAGDVALGLLADELGGVGDGLLGVGCEVGEAAAGCLANDRGRVGCAAGEDHDGVAEGDEVLRGVDEDLADAVAVAVAGVLMRDISAGVSPTIGGGLRSEKPRWCQ